MSGDSGYYRAVCLMDGGLGQELVRRQTGQLHELWSTKIMLDEPALVQSVHEDFNQAGARVMTINAYAATPERLARHNLEHLFAPLQQQACALAQQAREGRPDINLAGCLPPILVSYRPDQTLPAESMRASYQRIVEQQAEHVDLFLCETMSSAREGRVATEVAVQAGKPVWTAFTLDDDNGLYLRSGETLEQGLDTALDAGASALLVNCSRPEAISQAMQVLRRVTVPFGAYANGFTSVAGHGLGRTVEHLAQRQDLTPAAYAEMAISWVDAGASIIGGCCHVGPEHIAELAAALPAHGHQVVDGLSLMPGYGFEVAA